MSTLLASSTTSTSSAPATATGPSFFLLLLVGLGIMLLGNLLGRFISVRTHRTVSRRVYYLITIPIMLLFLVTVFVFGQSLSVVAQYALFAVYILAFSVLGGFVEAPPMPVRPPTPAAPEEPQNEQASIESGESQSSEPDSGDTGELPAPPADGDVVDGEGKDVTP